MTTQKIRPIRRITKQMLKENEACEYVYRRFARRWPRGITITYDHALEAHKLGFPLWWAVMMFLDPKVNQRYKQTLHAAYKAHASGKITTNQCSARLAKKCVELFAETWEKK